LHNSQLTLMFTAYRQTSKLKEFQWSWVEEMCLW